MNNSLFTSVSRVNHGKWHGCDLMMSKKGMFSIIREALMEIFVLSWLLVLKTRDDKWEMWKVKMMTGWCLPWGKWDSWFSCRTVCIYSQPLPPPYTHSVYTHPPSSSPLPAQTHAQIKMEHWEHYLKLFVYKRRVAIFCVTYSYHSVVEDTGIHRSCRERSKNNCIVVRQTTY